MVVKMVFVRFLGAKNIGGQLPQASVATSLQQVHNL